MEIIINRRRITVRFNIYKQFLYSKIRLNIIDGASNEVGLLEQSSTQLNAWGELKDSKEKWFINQAKAKTMAQFSFERFNCEQRKQFNADFVAYF